MSTEIRAEANLNDLRYVVIPSKLTRDKSFLDVYNKIYAFWESRWNETFTASGSPKGYWRDHFLRQDVVGAILNGDKVIACCLATRCNLNSNSVRSSEYFQYVSEVTYAKMKRDGIDYLTSIEYLCVCPSVQMNSQQISVGKLLMVLKSHLAESFGTDAMIGMPIRTTKVDKMLENIGGVAIQPDIDKYGYKLTTMLMSMRPRVTSKDSNLAAIAQQLWNKRQDYSGLTTENKNMNQKKAG